MPEYRITTERHDIGDRENWHVTIFDANGLPLIDRNGDTESEAVCIAAVELLGDLPADFPYPERSDQRGS